MVIKRSGKGCKVMSHSGKNMGSYKSMKGCKNRLRQVEYFKHKRGK
jgi:hypothetical protein